MFLAALPYFPALDPLILISGLALLISHGWFEINVNLLVSGLRAGRAAAVSLTRSLVGSCCGILFVWLGMGVPGVIFALVLGMVVPSCWMVASEWRSVTLGRPHWGRLREILIFGIPLSLTYALDSVVYYSDRMIIRYLGTPENVGHYAAGFDVADKSITAILSAIGMAGFAIALRTLDSDGREAAAKQLALNATTLLALGLPAAVGLAVTSPNIAALLGDQFKTEAARVIPIIAFAVLLGGLRGNYVDHAFHLSKSTMRFAMLVAFTAVLNIVLNFCLIPRFGWIGAAYASLTAYAVSLVANGIAGRHVFPLPYPVRNFAKIIAAAIVMGTAVAVVPTGNYPALVRLAIQVIVGASVYGAAVFALDLLGLREKILAVVLKPLGVGAARSAEHP
jgi:O-antigen/teichoic acid export membrane protein